MEAADPVFSSPAARWKLAAKRAGTHSLIVWPPLAVGWVLVVGVRRHAVAFDFVHAYLPAARALLAGHSPYPPATVAALSPRTAFVYPPLTGYLAAPFTVLPPTVAEALVSLLAIACIVGILLLLGVRDWRCYTVAFLWLPAYSAIQTGNVTLLLTLGLALVWRFRTRTLAIAVFVGFMIALKLFFWPLLVWLLATRRFRAAAGGVFASAILLLVPWAAIGFAGLRGYPHLLSMLSRLERRDGYTVPALLSGGVSWHIAELVGVAFGLAVLGAAVWIARSDERRSFALVIAAILLLTPIVAMHYFVFLIVVLALFKPRFGWAWALPLFFWIAPQVGNGADWQTAAALGVAAGTFALAVAARAARPTPATA
jgi:alpha-1,2-mannosyltransferase